MIYFCAFSPKKVLFYLSLCTHKHTRRTTNTQQHTRSTFDWCFFCCCCFCFVGCPLPLPFSPFLPFQFFCFTLCCCIEFIMNYFRILCMAIVVCVVCHTHTFILAQVADTEVDPSAARYVLCRSFWFASAILHHISHLHQTIYTLTASILYIFE
jgi:hypothetical protein